MHLNKLSRPYPQIQKIQGNAASRLYLFARSIYSFLSSSGSQCILIEKYLSAFCFSFGDYAMTICSSMAHNFHPSKFYLKTSLLGAHPCLKRSFQSHSTLDKLLFRGRHNIYNFLILFQGIFASLQPRIDTPRYALDFRNAHALNCVSQ